MARGTPDALGDCLDWITAVWIFGAIADEVGEQAGGRLCFRETQAATFAALILMPYPILD
jgi:hypothetical protein